VKLFHKLFAAMTRCFGRICRAIPYQAIQK